MLLASRPAVAVLRELAGGPLTRGELAARLPATSRSGLTRSIGELRQADLLVSEARAGLHHRVAYGLTASGTEMLEIIGELDAVQWRVYTRQAGGSAGRGLAQLIAEPGNAEIVRAILEGPLSFTDLRRLLPGLTDAALVRRLAHLQAGGLVAARQGPQRGRSRYELERRAQSLARTALLIMRWHMRWTPQDARSPACDISALVHLVAGRARTPEHMRGICQLGVTAGADGATSASVYVRLAEGRLWPLRLMPVGAPSARAHASAPVWYEALLGDPRVGMAVDGDRALAEAVVVALASALG